MTNLLMDLMEATEVMAHKRQPAVQFKKIRNKRFPNLLSPHIGFATACVCFLSPNSGFADEWRVDTHVSATETYTDNVGLASPGNEKSDFISEITPGISIFGKKGRSQLQVEYAPQLLVYAKGNQPNRLNHLLSAFGKAELASNWLFLDGGANISRENASLLGPVSLNNSVGTQNQTSIRTFRISPYVVNQFGPYVSYEIRYQHDGVDSSGDALSNSQSNKYSMNIVSGPAYSRYKWGLKLYKEDIDYTNAVDQESENASVDFSYFLTPRFGLTVTEGYEKYSYLSTGDKPQNNYWSAGIIWQPSSLTSLKASSGKHYYGKTYDLDFFHRSRTLLWTASYNESITTSRSNFLIQDTLGTAASLDKMLESIYPNPIDRANQINALIASGADIFNILSNQTFLQKRADASVTWYSGKTTIALSAFRDIRDAAAIGSISNVLGNASLNNNNNVRQHGSNFLFDWAFAPKTNVSFNTGFSDIRFRDTEVDQKLKYLRAGLRHQLTSKTTGFVQVRHEKSDANGGGSNYRENAISASVNLRF